MKIKRLEIQNYKGFNKAEVFLDGKSAIFFGVNGVGKSSILRSINILYAKIINRVVNNRRELRQQFNIELEDICYGKSYAEITAEFMLDSENENTVIYNRRMERKTCRRTHSEKSLNEIVSYIQKSYQSEEDQDNIPVFVNYGTNRLVLDIPLRIKKHHEFDIFSAYEKAIENRIDFRTFFEWYRNQEDIENSTKVEKQNFKYEDRSLSAVRKAMLSMLPGFKSVRISRKPRLAMIVKKDGMELNVSQLSDGEKCLLALFGDLAKRLALANPKLKNPLLGEGVVLIDEVELHMHPTWQRNIIRVLKNTFPNIQFIITTHSPIVLSEVDDSFKIFFLDKIDNKNEIIQVERLDGFDINYILEEHMFTKSRNEKTEKLVRELYSSINKSDISKSKELLEELILLTNKNNEDVVMAELIMKKKGMIE